MYRENQPRFVWWCLDVENRGLYHAESPCTVRSNQDSCGGV